jgi:hypothetical protein
MTITLRFVAASLVLLCASLATFVAGCGESETVQEEDVRALISELASDLIDKNKVGVAGKVDNYYAIGGSDPGSVKKWETEEGKKDIIEGHYRWLKMTLIEAGIVERSDIPRLMANITVHPGSQLGAIATFEIAADKEKKLSARVVTLNVSRRGDGKMRITGYNSEFKR